MYLNIVIALILAEIGNKRIFCLPDCGVRSESFSPRETRIIGGKGVQIGQYPWVVALLLSHDCASFNQICGGTIISEQWILTAAHCVCPSSPHLYRILAGVTDLFPLDVPSKNMHRVSEIFIHPKYDETRYRNDIALIRLLTPIEFSTSPESYINRICLPAADEDTGRNFVTAGWGINDQGVPSNRLRKVRLSVVDNVVCNDFYKENDDNVDITENILCAARRNVDSCYGDSGGPLMKKNRLGVYTLIGIVSYGYECAYNWDMPPYVAPAVYTRVSQYTIWIKKVMEQSEKIRPEFNEPLYYCYNIDRIRCLPRRFE